MAVYLGNRKKRIKKGPIIIGIILILVLIGGGIFFFTSGKAPETTVPETPETTEPVEGATTGTLPTDAFPIKVTN
ncbi:MAG: hypothetical protein ACRCWD_05520 [Culicoidibacterales bacterium]